jgi:hypothetical protein
MKIRYSTLVLAIAVVLGVMIVTAQQGTAVAPNTAAQATAGRGLYQANCAPAS